MPKVKLEFKLPEEQKEYAHCMEAINYHCVIDEYRNYLRQKYKHIDYPNEGAEKEFQELSNKFFEIISDFQINN